MILREIPYIDWKYHRSDLGTGWRSYLTGESLRLIIDPGTPKPHLGPQARRGATMTAFEFSQPQLSAGKCETYPSLKCYVP